MAAIHYLPIQFAKMMLKIPLQILFISLITFLVVRGTPKEVSLDRNSDRMQEDTFFVDHLITKSQALEKKGDYQSALVLLEQAYILYVQQEAWEKAITCLVQQSKLADHFDTVDAKLQYSQTAMQLAQLHLTSNHPIFATVLRQYAEALIWIEKVDSANQILLSAIPIFQQNQLWVDWGWSEILLGVNYLNTSKLEDAQIHLENVKQLLGRKILEKRDSLNIQPTLQSLLGILYQAQGDYDRAIGITKEALQITLANFIDSVTLTTHLSNLGVFYLTKGDHKRALDYYMQALHNHPTTVEDDIILFNIADLLLLQGKYEQGIDYLNKTLEIVKNRPTKYKTQIDVFNRLANTFIEMGIYDSASYYCQKMIALQHNYRKSTSWSILGKVAYAQNQPQQAIAHFSNATQAYQKDSTAESHSPFYLANIYTHLGNAHTLNGNPQKALSYYQKALIINHATFDDSLHIDQNPSLEDVYNPEYFTETLHGKAKTLASFTESKTQMETALKTYQLLGQWIDTLLIGHATEAASLDWTGTFKQIYEEAIGVAYHLYQETQDLQYIEIAFAFSEKSKNSLLLESLKATEGKAYAGVPDSLLQKEKDLNIDMAFYEKALQEAEQNQDTAKIKLYQQYLSDTRLQLANFQEQLEQDFPKYHSLKYGGESSSIAEVQAKLLEEETAFVEYFIGDSAAYVFVITSSAADLIQLEASNSLQQKTTAVHKLLLNPYTFRQDAKNTLFSYQNKANDLYQAILQPVTASFTTPIERLVIVTDEFLHAIPLEALTKTTTTIEGINFMQLPFVLYDYSLQYAYSANLLLKNQERQMELSSNTECLAFAPPYQGTDTVGKRGSFAQLRSTGKLEGTAREIQAIAQYFNGHFDFGKTATERQFKANAHQFGILHLAMHGIPDLENPNFNHLKFSDLEADSLEDNLLHHYEIANLDLQAQLAVLSACETGVGKYEKGEGVYSLARSFMYAGVPSVVMSLWKVSDYSTSHLMPLFYENLSEGQSKEMALRGAKIRFLEEAKLEHRHPFYWSAFVLLGDNRAIQRDYGSWWNWGIGLLVLVILTWGIKRLMKP